MTYYSTPTSTQTPAASQPQILQNFTQIANSYNTDHVPLTGSTQGYHKQVTLNAPLAGDPGLAANICSLYTKLVSGTPQLFFQNGALASNVEQITGASSIAGSGYIIVGGVYIQWGSASWPGNNNTVSFPISFPTACFIAMCQNANSGSNATYMNVTAVTQSTFRVFSPNVPTGSNLFFIAIGH